MADHQHSHEKLHDRSTSSSSSSGDENPPVSHHQPIKPVNRPVGAADLFLWRDKKRSASIRAGATVLWILFECMEYHFLTVVGHVLILSLAILFIWINSAAFLKRSQQHIPVIAIREDTVHNIASEFYGAFADLREAVTGTDLKKFVLVVAVIWVNAVIGSCGSFLLTIFSFMRIRKIRSRLQEIAIPKDAVHNLASELRFEVNIVFADLYEAVTGPDKEKFVLVVASLWLPALIGSWCDFLTLAIVLPVAHTVRFLYEKYEDQIDSFVHLLDSFVHLILSLAHKVSLWKPRSSTKLLMPKF